MFNGLEFNFELTAQFTVFEFCSLNQPIDEFKLGSQCIELGLLLEIFLLFGLNYLLGALIFKLYRNQFPKSFLSRLWHVLCEDCFLNSAFAKRCNEAFP